jgi:hypothetical protein
MARIAAFLIVGLMGLPGASWAQITGRVATPSGEAVEGATVELWSIERRLAARLTDEEGRFSFSGDLASEASGFYVGRLGYNSLQIPFQAGRLNYEITLEESAIPLQGFVVEAEVEQCFEDGDRVARELWEGIRPNYNDAIDTVGVATYLARAEVLVPIGEVGPVELPEFAPSQRGSNSLLRFSWRRYVKNSGYARPVRRTDLSGSYASWTYPPLEADFSPHFVDDVFGEIHHFKIEAEDAGGWTIAFCPEDLDEGRPWLRGRLRIAPDTTLQWAEWSFITPEPDEGAGGRAVFPPVTGDRETTYLLPSEGLFYRRTKDETFLQQYQRFEGWILSAGDSVPFLPLKAAEADSSRSGPAQTR